MRKFVSLLLVFAVFFTFAACGNTPQTSSAGESSEVSERSSEADISKMEQELSEVQSEIDSVIEEMSKGNSSETTSAETSSDSSEISSEGSSSEDSAYSESSQEISPILTGKPSLGVPNDEQFEALLNAVAYVRECYDNKEIAFRLNSGAFSGSLMAGDEEVYEWTIIIDNEKKRLYIEDGWNDREKAENLTRYRRENGTDLWKVRGKFDSFEETKEMMFLLNKIGISYPLFDAAELNRNNFLVVAENDITITFAAGRLFEKAVNVMPLFTNSESKQQNATTLFVIHKSNGRLYQLRSQFELTDDTVQEAKGRFRFQEANWFFGYKDDPSYTNGIRWDSKHWN